MTLPRRKFRPTGKWKARVEWIDEQAPAQTPTSAAWLAVNCWVTGVLTMHGASVKRIIIEPAGRD